MIIPTDRYVLDEDGEPAPCPDFFEWNVWFMMADRTIAYTEIGDLIVSTVFLGIDHNHSRIGPPLLFETMVFRGEIGGDTLGDQLRYATRAHALAGHARVVDWIQGRLTPLS